MKNLFNSIKLTSPGKNAFDLTHDVKMSCNMGDLVPIMCLEAVPGDKFDISCESLLRFAPLVSPVMHRMDVTMHYFFVPNRIVWANWEAFITNSPNGPTPAFPTITYNLAGYLKLHDYLGLPIPHDGNEESVSAIPFAVYQAIYNEYYRDQNLIDEQAYKLADGDNSALFGLGVMKKRAWEHDYFTAALPFAQKGAAVDIPLGDVVLKQPGDETGPGGRILDYQDYNDPITGALSSDAITGSLRAATDNRVGVYDPQGSLETEATTINDLRRAFKLQEWLEKMARGGSRYVEQILSIFGIKSSDKRLQRPEYITGTKSPVVISEILNTTGTDDLPQGNMSGHGVSVTSGKYGHYFCEEHGYIMGIMSVTPRTAYQQGIPKHFLKYKDLFQYYWPQFANIGEQEVEAREIYAFQGAAGDETFGYVPRYAEYKYQPSRVAGQFRTSLDFWHLGRIFATPPLLDKEFVECNPDPRIFAVTDENVDKLYVHVLNKVKAVRPMPKYGTPTF